MDCIDPLPPGGRFRRALRLIGWNALLLIAGVALVGLAGEAWFRLTVPFMRSSRPLEFVPNVGYLRPPNTEIRHTNHLDFWNISRTNSLGFLDREPPSPERAAATCHVSVIGDSFVEATEVPIDRKLHVRLEELAADRLPRLDVTTSAFGLENTGQIQQLPFYDEYARRLHPKLLVLVFVDNDFRDNTPALKALRGRPLEPIVRKRSDGEFQVAYPPPPPQDQLPEGSLPRASWADRDGRDTIAHSRFAVWLYRKIKMFIHVVEKPRRQPDRRATLRRAALREDTLPYTRFALEQFKQRADRDGVKLVILAIHRLKLPGLKLLGKTRMFERMSQMAATLDIPVIDQADYILRQGAVLLDAQWTHDIHWNPAGHQWAAEALLEYIEQRPEVCDGWPPSARLPGSTTQ